MPLFTAPDSNGEDLVAIIREFNVCHAPAGGASGGQFCSAPDAGSGGGPAPKRAERYLKSNLTVSSRSKDFVQASAVLNAEGGEDGVIKFTSIDHLESLLDKLPAGTAVNVEFNGSTGPFRSFQFGGPFGIEELRHQLKMARLVFYSEPKKR